MNHRLAVCLCASVAATPVAAEDAALIFEILCDRTLHYFTPGIGNQIEYTAPNGAAYLWFPGAPGILEGVWAVSDLPDGSGQVCYDYPAGSFGNPEASTFCFNYGGLFDDVPEEGGIRGGDPYDLATGEIPFPIAAAPPLDLETLAEDYPDRPRARACGVPLS